MNQLQNTIITIWQEIKNKAETQVQIFSSEKAICFDYAWIIKEYYKNNVKLDFEVSLFDDFSDGCFLDI